MSLMFKDFGSSSFAKFFSHFGTLDVSGNDFPRSVDPIYLGLSNILYDLGVLQVEPLLGAYPSSPVEEVVLRTKPRHVDYSASADFHRYGSFLDHVSKTASFLRGESLASFEPRNEHGVYHATYDGDAGPQFGWTDILSFPLFTSRPGPPFVSTGHSSLGMWDNPINTHYISFDAFSGRLDGVTGSLSLGGYVFTPIFYPHGPYQQVGSKFSEYVSQLNSQVVPVGRTWSGSYHLDGAVATYSAIYVDVYNLSIVYDPDDPYQTTSLRYTLNWSLQSGTNVRYYSSHNVAFSLRNVLAYPPQDHHFANGDPTGVEYFGSQPNVVLRYADECTFTGGSLQAFWDLKTGRIAGSTMIHGETFNTIFLRSYPGVGTGGSVPISIAATNLGKSGLLSDFQRKVGKYETDIRLSAMLSAADATSNISESLDKEVVQTLVKIRDISGNLPDYHSALRAISDLAGGRPIASVRDIVDFLTSLRLTHQFTWRSEFDLLLADAPKIASIAESIAALSNSNVVVTRGSFHYDFPSGEFGRESSRLVTRTKLISNVAGKQQLIDLVGVNAIGLSPLPSTSWDLIPFSFVLNWFTGIGARLRDIEQTSILTLLGARCFCHSYLITSDLTDDEMDHFGFIQSGFSGSVRPHLRVYMREVSSYMPPIRQGRYDFRLPARGPNWATAGSLLWQLFAT